MVRKKNEKSFLKRKTKFDLEKILPPPKALVPKVLKIKPIKSKLKEPSGFFVN